MAMTKYDMLKEMKDSIGYDELLQTLSYYNIEVKNKKMLCPFPNHNDRHLGNCSLNDRGYIFCFACNQHANAVDLVMIKEGLDFVPALEFLWTNILGRQMPHYMKMPKQRITAKELAFIGLGAAQGRYIWMYTNQSCNKDEVVPEGCYIEHRKNPEEDNYNIYRKERADSFYDLLDSNPEAAKMIALEKCKETKTKYLVIINELNDSNTEMGKTASYDRSFKQEASMFCKSQIWKTEKLATKIKSL